MCGLPLQFRANSSAVFSSSLGDSQRSLEIRFSAARTRSIGFHDLFGRCRPCHWRHWAPSRCSSSWVVSMLCVQMPNRALKRTSTLAGCRALSCLVRRSRPALDLKRPQVQAPRSRLHLRSREAQAPTQPHRQRPARGGHMPPVAAPFVVKLTCFHRLTLRFGYTPNRQFNSDAYGAG